MVPDGQEPENESDWDGYYVYRSRTNGIYFLLRGLFTSVDDLSPGVESVESIRFRPLSGDAADMQYVRTSDTPVNALFPRDASFFDALDAFIQSDRADSTDPYTHGVLAALGIRQGQTFAPPRGSGNSWAWPRRQRGRCPRPSPPSSTANPTPCGGPAASGSPTPRPSRTTSGTHSSTRSSATVPPATPTSTPKPSAVVGAGAKYANAYRDRDHDHDHDHDHDGNLLRGEDTYTIDLPADPPAQLFWSLTLYDAETAAEVDAEDQTFSSLNGMNDIVFNDNRSITLHTGPERPAGAANWIKTVPGRGWFAIIRFYGPEEAFFDRQYTPGDFEKAVSA
ncbi:DUF1214 domain-containing protein [Streptomyces sp. NPDC052042]|uniref:DUF1214 domain-containing protein n=1 Tax=Streptomyces sp. NPDC052042 TaxID=3365683 RepID=UPI0037D1DCA3